MGRVHAAKGSRQTMRERGKVSRRSFAVGCVAASALGAKAMAEGWNRASQPAAGGRAQLDVPLDQNWLFGGKSTPEALEPEFDDGKFARVTLPHTVTTLGWQNWDPGSWQDVWIYRQKFSIPSEMRGMRLFLEFDRVNAAATAVMNGQRLEPHQGGFLPFRREITQLAKEENVLALEVDARWLNVPPMGSPKGPSAVDYLLPGGITGSVRLRAVPQIYLREVFAKPVDVLKPERRVELQCSVDAAGKLPAQLELRATLKKGAETIATVKKSVLVEQSDQEFAIVLAGLMDVLLWDTDHPHLYDLEVSVWASDGAVHTYATRIGFREARFALDGFSLNGKRTQIFGLNRHELYPYIGFAAPARLERRDAEMLRHEFNCNFVRCSHYPQAEAFLDACDELGLMVWQEPPGWQYIGDDQWKDLAVSDVEAMVRRDRNHAAIVVWGVRINESHNDEELYRRTTEAAKRLDGTRPCSGSMTSIAPSVVEGWHEDVYAFDDYHAEADGSVEIADSVPGVPFMFAETVGQFNYAAKKGFDRKYRRAGDVDMQTSQAIYHAEAHDRAARSERCAGAVAWCAVDYASLMNAYQAVKCPGVADVFRIPKLGAASYLSQVDPAERPMIEPNFYWHFGPETLTGPGAHAAIFSNCERLEIFIDGKPHAELHPDRANFPNLRYPPFFADLKVDGAGNPELRIDGYKGSTRLLTRRFSSDRTHDRLWLRADDMELAADGADATRLAFAVVDKYGALHAFGKGKLILTLEGPGVLVGDNPFALEENGGAGAVWVKTLPGKVGTIRISANHDALGGERAEIRVTAPKATG
jgi:beta-galactosidase